VQVGAVFRWSHDDRPSRVLVHDRDVVMYDAWWPHLGNWGLADVQLLRKKRIGYYVALTATLAEHASYVRLDPLTDHEAAIHRPDLPFAIGQCVAISWPSEVPGTAAEFAEDWRAAGCPDGGMVRAPDVYLYPFGPDGEVWAAAGARVQAANGTVFPVEELLFKAAAVQAPFISGTAPTQGIGIYRDGLYRGIPAYYLGGFESRLHAASR
jgi:hypothetical protein